MASQPPQQPQRRSTPAQQTQDESFQQVRRAESQAPSTTSVDSQTVFLNSSSTSADQPRNAPADQADSAKQTIAKTSSVQSETEPRKCWICFSDETEDTPESSVWRTPCPCALTAHESCLLDWIADIESPDATRSTPAPTEIRCPQCKAQIFLSRPRSTLLETVGQLEKYASKLLLPGVAAGTLYTLLLAFSHHGAHTIRTIFDEHDAEAILSTRTWAEMNRLEREALLRFPSFFKPFFREWRGFRVELGLPLIPAALVASRSTLADAILPILPVVFFATHAPSSKTLSLEYWPPSAALTLVTLPYIRSAYDAYLERVWGDLERGWIKEVKPRASEEFENGQGNGPGGGHPDGDEDFEVDFEVELNLGGGGNDEEDDVEEDERDRYERDRFRYAHMHDRLDHGHNQDEDAAAPPPDIPARGVHGWHNAEAEPDDLADAVELAAVAQAAEDAEAMQGDRQRQDDQERDAHDHDRNGDHEHRVDLLSTAHTVADTVFGALLFPLISEGSGELLRLLLPLSWTVAPRKGRWGIPTPTGLLQTKWGRSIVGGCLFVVLKDAVRIYCRWRLAVIFRERRVRDYDKKLKKLV